MRTGYEVYAGYLQDPVGEFDSAGEVMLPVKDLERLESRLVRARIGDAPGPGWQDLWVRQADRSLAPQRLAIQILEDFVEKSGVPGRHDIQVSAVEAETMSKVKRLGGPRYARYSGDGYLGGYFIGQLVVVAASKGPLRTEPHHHK